MTIVVHGRARDEGDREFPSRQDLVNVLERIHEEIRLARLLVRQIELPEALAPHMMSSLREALLMRVLRLRHFFYGRAEEEWELVASDYFPDPSEWISSRPSAPPHLSRWLDDLVEWVDERVFANPEGRVPPKAWPLASLVDTLTVIHASFCEMIVEHHEQPFVNLPWPRTSEEDIVSNPFEESPSGTPTREDAEADSESS